MPRAQRTTSTTTHPSAAVAGLFGERDRVTEGFDRMRAQIAKRITDGLTTAEKVEATGRALDMTFPEYARFQEAKSLAVAGGTLTLAEGMTVYRALGNAPEHFNAQPVHVKAVLTSLFEQLLGAEIAARGGR